MHALLCEIVLRIVVVITLMAASCTQVHGGDFILIAAVYNHSIFAGSMKEKLRDLAPLPLEGVDSPEAVGYDPAENMVYWTQRYLQDRHGILSRAHLNGTEQMVLVNDLKIGVALDLDLVARMIYWTDHTQGHIGRVPMNGSGTKEIIIDGLRDPSGILTDHNQGYIYWTSVGGGDPKIERANLDGTNRTILVANNLLRPQAVFIDHEANQLYWSDGQRDVIERSDLLGNNREVVVNVSMYAPIHPYDLSIYNDYIYWSDPSHDAVIRIPLSGGRATYFGPRSFDGIRRIHIQTEPDYCESSPCPKVAICDDIINGFVCQCPPGLHGANCSENACSSSPCLNGGNCTISSAGFTCTCPSQYEGPTCASDACSSSPCLNGGSCTISSAGFTCTCPSQYEGQTCEREESTDVALFIGIGAAAFILVLLIAMIAILKIKKTRNKRERVVNIPEIAFCNAPEPAYEVAITDVHPRFQDNMNMGPPAALPRPVYLEILD